MSEAESAAAPAREPVRPCIERLTGPIFCTLIVGHDGWHLDEGSGATWPQRAANEQGESRG